MKSYVLDMDGVLYRGNQLIPGAREFIERLQTGGHPFLFLTNNSQRTPLDFQRKLEKMGLTVSAEHYFTSAMATAAFLQSQKPGGTAFVIGEAGLTHALYQAGYSITDVDPDYVVLGDTPSYDYAKIVQAVKLILNGARFIATNPDVTGPQEEGIHPACGALAAPIERATGTQAYYVGKPNPLMMREALRRLNAPLRRLGDDRGPDGHGHPLRHRGRDAHRPGPDGRHDAGGPEALLVPAARNRRVAGGPEAGVRTRAA